MLARLGLTAPPLALAGLIAALPLLAGATQPLVWSLVAAAVALLCLQGHSAWRSAPRLPNRLWLAYLCWLGVYLVPLPFAWIEVLSPQAASVHEAVGAATGSHWATLSISPAASQRFLLQSLCLYLLWRACGASLANQTGLSALLVLVTTVAVLQALLGLVQIGADRPFAQGSFVNRNHYAGWMALTACAILSALFAQADSAPAHSWRLRVQIWLDALRSPRFVLRVVLLLVITAVVVSRSRGGNLGLAAGLLGVSSLALLTRQSRRSAVLIAASVLLLDVLLIAPLFGLNSVVARFAAPVHEQEPRALLWASLPSSLAATQGFGSGPGSFSVLSAQFKSWQVLPHFDHAHQEYWEFWLEIGPVGCTLLAALVLWHVACSIRLACRGKHRWQRSAALATFGLLVATAVQAAVEFQLRVPAIAFAAVAMMGIASQLAVAAHHSRPIKPPAPL